MGAVYTAFQRAVAGEHTDGGDGMRTTIRPGVDEDADPCGRIIYAAFKGIAELHNFPPDFPSVAAGVRTARFRIAHPAVFSVVAEQDGRIAGSGFLDQRDPIGGVGPISVDPAVQKGGVGRAIMHALLARGEVSAGIRLVQDAFNTVSMPLYASLGFEVKEPLVLIGGTPRSRPPDEVEVRQMTLEDLDACAELCVRVHGLARTGELRDSLRNVPPFVVVRDGCITAYTSSVTMRGHGVAETEADMTALLWGAAAATAEPPAFLLPIRQASFFRWCLSKGLRVIKPMNLMAIGAYQEPRGCWFPSILY